MQLSEIKISQKEIEDELRRISTTAEAAGAVDNACAAYKKVKPAVEVAAAILGAIYPPGAVALVTMKVILDKACDDQSSPD